MASHFNNDFGFESDDADDRLFGQPLPGDQGASNRTAVGQASSSQAVSGAQATPARAASGGQASGAPAGRAAASGSSAGNSARRSASQAASRLPGFDAPEETRRMAPQAARASQAASASQASRSSRMANVPQVAGASAAPQAARASQSTPQPAPAPRTAPAAQSEPAPRTAPAPQSEPVRAASAPHTASDVGFVPIMGDGTGKRKAKGNRRRESHFRETDPYDLSGHRAKPHRRVARVISTLLFIVGIVLLVAAGGLYLYNQIQYQAQDEINEELAAYAQVSDDTSQPTAPTVDWEGLKAINSDVVGWVQIPGTVVNFPVYQTTDNETYLHTNAKGEYSLGGQIFLDAENAAPGMVDAQSIIYGHHLRNGAMFKAVSDMSNQEMFDSVSTVWYVTETATYELEPLLLYETDDEDEAARTFNFASTDEFHAYLNELLAKSVTSCSDAAEKIASAEKVFTLCTCNYTSDDDSGRTLLVCVLKSSGEAAEAGGEADTADTADAEAGAADAGAAEATDQTAADTEVVE